jgi:hypothetical protein
MIMTKLYPILAVAGCLALNGCGTNSPNPHSPKPNTGYVDFYTDSSLDLTWQVKRRDEANSELRTVLSDYQPVQGTILRLAAPPGNHQFQIWIVNRITTGPQDVKVPIENGQVTPVHVTLTPAGTNFVQNKVYGFRPSAKGYGRGTKITREEERVYDTAAVAEKPQPYRVKEQMPYFQPEPKSDQAH